MRRREAGSGRRVHASVLCAIAVAAPVVAQADTTDRALAETLFQEGKKLMAGGRYTEACPKLAESHRLDPGGGTLLVLGLCHEQEGRTGSAWGELNEALAVAIKEARADRKAVAEKHLSTLEPKVSRLTVRVAPGLDEIAGVEVDRDGQALGKPAWGVAAPVDPGEHHVEARAPGKKRWSTTVTVAAVADSVVLDVPLLEDEPLPPASAEPAPSVGLAAPARSGPSVVAPARVERSTPSVDGGVDRRTAGYVIGAVGLASIAFGSYFGVRAIVKGNEVDDLCPSGRCAGEHAGDGPRLNEEARAAADAATVSFVLGAVGVGVGTALVLTSRPRRAAPAPTSVAVVVTGAGGRVTGAW